VTGDRVYRYRGRLVLAPPELVWAAQACPVYNGSGRQFSAAAGLAIGLVAGILGAGALYLMFGSREPRMGEQVLGIPKGEDNPAFRGVWGGYDPLGNMVVDRRPRDPDSMDLIGPLVHRSLGDNKTQEIIDLSRGWASHEALAKFKAAHNREGYGRRKNPKRNRRAQ
jgi:hypothetical protein